MTIHCSPKQPWVVTVVQRFGSDLRLNVHFHTLMLEAVFVDGSGTELTFCPLVAPSDKEVLGLLEQIIKRVEKVVRKRGDPHNAGDVSSDGQTELVAAAAQGKSTSGTRAGRPAAKLGQVVADGFLLPETPIVGVRNVQMKGYSLHANVAVHANDREGLERLAGYLARGPIATKRLSVLQDGRLAYALRRPWRDGTMAIALTKREFLERLAAQVPRPREHLTRYAGVLAPNHAMRSRVCRDRESVREEEREQTRRRLIARMQEAVMGQPSQAVVSCEPLPSGTWKWADLLRRVFKLDILECPKCGERCKVLAVLTDPFVVSKFLEAVGESSETPTPVRGPPLDEESQLALGR